MLSVLIPTYNDECYRLVCALASQAETACPDGWEIIVADDVSTDEAVVRENEKINTIAHCRFIKKPTNDGRAAIRNYLAQQALGDWLLFIDSDMTMIEDDYLKKYHEAISQASVVYGGYRVMAGPTGNLRYLYERKAEPFHTVTQRWQQPYRDFHTSNFLIQRGVMLAHPLDERFRHYGYEDVFFGRQLQEAGISIHHIDAPVGFCRFESNDAFVSKTEEGIRTLHTFHDELQGYSRLIRLADRLGGNPLGFLVRLCYRLMRGCWRRNLCSNKPSLRCFKLYKLGYYLSL